MGIKNEAAVREYEVRINRVLRFIHENLDKDLPLEKLSETACFSPFHFHRIFFSIIGETPKDFVKRLRLEKAANLLINNSLISVTEVALSCGFSSPASFARSFKDYFNCSASFWRTSGFEEYSRFIKEDRKKCKVLSKNGKEFTYNSDYFSDANDSINKQNIWRTEMDIIVKSIPAMHIAYATHIGGYNSEVGKSFEKLCRWAGPRGLIGRNSVFLGLSLDNPDITPEGKCRYYASMTVPQGTEPSQGIEVMDIPQLTCAVYRYEGMQDGIERAYKEAYDGWLPQSGFVPDDFPCFEIYIKDPNEHPKGKFIMDVCIPVKPL